MLSLSSLEQDFSASRQEWIILMNNSFSTGQGDLKHEKPATDG
jgi:hypothetical protein